MYLVESERYNKIVLGYIGEHKVEQVQFDVSAWLTKYGSDGVFTLLHQRNTDTYPYPVQCVLEGNVLTWTITDVDVSVLGTGKCELRYAIEDRIKLSRVFDTYTMNSLLVGDAPEPYEEWLKILLELADITTENANSAEKSANKAKESADNADESESNALTSAINAKTSETNAENSAILSANKADLATEQAIIAVQAKEASETAQRASETAQNKAEIAQTKAETAQHKAEDAQQLAETAQHTAESARDDAIQAKQDAIDAVTSVNKVNIVVSKHENIATVTATDRAGNITKADIYDGAKGDKGDKGDTGDTYEITEEDYSAIANNLVPTIKTEVHQIFATTGLSIVDGKICVTYIKQ